jgi:hypothetical protein
MPPQKGFLTIMPKLVKAPARTTVASEAASMSKRREDESTVKNFDGREHRRMEELATTVASKFRAYHSKLKDLLPDIEKIHDYFITTMRGTYELAGVRSFDEFCRKRLGLTRQAVYTALGKYRDKGEEKKRRKPTGKPEEEDYIPREAVVRMRDALDKVQQARNAKTVQEADAAWREYDAIAQAKPLPSTMDAMLKSRIVGDKPDFQKLLRDVLLAALQMQQALTNIVEAGVLDEGSALLAAARAALEQGRILIAVRNRLSISPPMN